MSLPLVQFSYEGVSIPGDGNLCQSLENTQSEREKKGKCRKEFSKEKREGKKREARERFIKSGKKD